MGRFSSACKQADKKVHQKLFNNTQQKNTTQGNLTDHEKSFLQELARISVF